MPTKLRASDLVRSLSSKQKFIPLLEKSIAKNDYKWEFKYEPKESDDAWHPSGDCTPTIRDLFLIAKDRLDPDSSTAAPSLGLRKTFMVGHFWHQWLQFHAVKAGLADLKNIECSESKWWGEPRLKFEIDRTSTAAYLNRWPKTATHVIQPKPFHWVAGSADIAPAILGSDKWIIDFKTMNPGDFSLTSPPERFADKWECQMNIYMDLFGYNQTCVIGIDKLTGAMKEFIYYRNDELIDTIYHKWRLVSGCLDENIEPPEDEDIVLPLRGVSE